MDTTTKKQGYRFIDSQEKLEQAIIELKEHKLIGLDTETFFDKTRVEQNVPVVSILQLSIELEDRYRIYVIDMLTGSRNGKSLANLDLTNLMPILEDKSVLKVIHKASYDVVVLYKDRKIEIKNVHCTLKAEQFANKTRKHKIALGLSDLTELYLGYRLDKSLQESNWYTRPLSVDQVKYGATDAKVLLEIYPKQLELNYPGKYELPEKYRPVSGIALAEIEIDEAKPLVSVAPTTVNHKLSVYLRWLEEYVEGGGSLNARPTTINLDTGYPPVHIHHLCTELYKFFITDKKNYLYDDLENQYTGCVVVDNKLDVLENLYNKIVRGIPQRAYRYITCLQCGKSRYYNLLVDDICGICTTDWQGLRLTE